MLLCSSRCAALQADLNTMVGQTPSCTILTLTDFVSNSQVPHQLFSVVVYGEGW